MVLADVAMSSGGGDVCDRSSSQPLALIAAQSGRAAGSGDKDELCSTGESLMGLQETGEGLRFRFFFIIFESCFENIFLKKLEFPPLRDLTKCFKKH